MKDFLSGTVTRQDWLAVGAILGSAALLCAVFYFFIYGDKINQIIEIESQTATLQQNLIKAQTMNRNIEALRQDTQKINLLVDEFEKRLPMDAEIQRLVQEVESFQNEVGVQVEMSPLAPIQDARKEEIPYNVVARGDFHRLAEFINRLERHERYLKVSKLTIGEEKDGISEAKFTLSTYRFLAGAEAPPANQTASTATTAGSQQ